MKCVQSEDWVIHADSDQFHEFPMNDAPLFLAMTDEMRYDSVYGYYVDRVTKDGTVVNITAHRPIHEQFPLACHISTQIVQLNRYKSSLNTPSKIMAFKGYLSENQGGGQIADRSQNCALPVRLRTHHYKWSWAVIRKMEMRNISESKTPFGYQSTNVLKHLNLNNGRFDVKNDRYKCEEIDKATKRPASSLPVEQCAKFHHIDNAMQRLD